MTADPVTTSVSRSEPTQAQQQQQQLATPSVLVGGRPRRAVSVSRADQQAKMLRPFSTGNFNVLLLENVNKTAANMLIEQGYQVEQHAKALPEDVLIDKIRNVHAIGIRSKTQLSERVLREAKNLLVIGCFCIGTNQVDLEYAAKRGISVFNSPFSNSRSVAELVIAEIIMLARQLGDRNNEGHSGVWNKVSAGCYEIRGKTLGIVGYGHIGSQLSVLAEAMGMTVCFYDVLPIMPLGVSKPCKSLEELLRTSDFVSLHVPETLDTKNMISAEQLAMMKKGSYLINASRGTVVDIPALAAALKSRHLGGAAVDVYPTEPLANGPGWATELAGCPNTILTPHIGGSTEEAQYAIGLEVANHVIRYINYGSTLQAVNYPEIRMRDIPASEKMGIRVVNAHHNVPGVLRQLNNILADHNVEKQMCDSKGSIAYFMADLNVENEEVIRELYRRISDIPESIITRVLY
ncbi:hypothetical protein GQ42DRAFT_160542 [Ramicandelaber brevisporus]|nr:hypothetical protein GQ42DRAFT_160542 [Ramicandelaber brevisporus]